MNSLDKLKCYLKKNPYKKGSFLKAVRLTTDDLEEKYGPISARVLKHDNMVRVCHLVDRLGISRTFAVTFLDSEGRSAELSIIDQEIKLGNPIGKTFRKHQYSIYKNVIEVFVIELPEWLKIAFQDKRSYAEVQISEILIHRENASIGVYGIIAEIYCPDFKPTESIEVEHIQKMPRSLLISSKKIISLKEQLYKILEISHI